MNFEFLIFYNNSNDQMILQSKEGHDYDLSIIIIIIMKMKT